MSAPAPPPPASPAGLGPTSSAAVGKDCTCVVDVTFPCDDWASIVFNALAVDAELQPDKVSREMSIHGPKLRVGFAATEARLLRAAYSAFMDVLILATRTLEQFGGHLRHPR
eukprot:SM000024S07765  [mRNA]  locus=s24:385009:385966:- [translate_table: standard]